MKKVYLHFEQPPAFTQIAKCGPAPTPAPAAVAAAAASAGGSATAAAHQGRSVEQLAAEFVAAYNAKHGSERLLTAADVELLVDRKPLPRHADAFTLLEDKADVYVQLRAGPKPAAGERASAPAAAAPAAAPAAAASTPPEPTEATTVVRGLLASAVQAHGQKRYAYAGALYLQALSAAPAHRTCLLGLGLLSLAIARWGEAEKWLREGVTAHPADPQLHARLGDALLGAGQPKAAVEAYEAAAALLRTSAGGASGTGGRRAAVPSARPATAGAAAIDALAGNLPGAKDLTPAGLTLAAARARYAIGSPAEQQAAASAVMEVLRQDEGHFDALYEYLCIASDRGMVEDAVRVGLRLITMQPPHRGVRERLAAAALAPGGLDALRKELGPALKSGPALGFLASALKDHGAVAPAVVLYQLAAAAEPQSAAYALNLVHTLEVLCEYDQAVAAAETHLIARRGRGLPGGSAAAALPARVAALLAGLPQRQLDSGGWWLADAAWAPPAPAAEANAPPSSVLYEAEALDLLALLFTTVKILFVGGALARARAIAALVEPARLASAKSLHETLIRNEAAYFGCAYQLMGEHPLPPHTPEELAAAAALAAEAAAAGLRARRDEQASTSSGAGGSSAASGSPGGAPGNVPVPAEAGAAVTSAPSAPPPPLFLAGDSHCLTGAWRTVRLRGQSRRLVPVLVTGLKAWHLRPESRFYPKLNFLAAMNEVPDGAQVIMLFGEIDCREGLLVSVERGRYRDLEEGIRTVVSIYVEILLGLAENRKWEVLVHPVPPVLNETRPIVLLFNRLLKQRIAAAAPTPRAAGRLHWLELLPSLLLPTADGTPPSAAVAAAAAAAKASVLFRLKPELCLDGTHLSPVYLRSLDDALAGLAL